MHWDEVWYAFEQVLAEVLQQQARVDDPMAAQRRKFLRFLPFRGVQASMLSTSTQSCP